MLVFNRLYHCIIKVTHQIDDFHNHNNFLIDYCFLKIMTPFAAKSRRDGEKRKSDSDSAAENE